MPIVEHKISPVRSIHFNHTFYSDFGLSHDPAIEDDRINTTLNVCLKKKFDPLDFELVVTPTNPEQPDYEIKISACNADSEQCAVKSQFIKFYLTNLNCNTDYSYRIEYKGVPIIIDEKRDDSENIAFKTRPARLDPQPFILAAGGDQERNPSFGWLGKLFQLDNYSITKMIYRHIGGDSSITDFFHLGDLINGEYNVSLTNLFKRGRKFIEFKVKTLTQFRAQLNQDWDAPVKQSLAGINVNALVDDHDLGRNGGPPATTEEEKKVQKKMIQAYHEHGLLPDFLKLSAYQDKPYDPENPFDTPRKGPYFKERYGQHEVFFLHNRYTKDTTREDAYLLGPEQWEWLEDSLKRSTATNKILVSPLPLVMGKNPGEDYRGHSREWERLLQLCRTYQIGVILAGDSHLYSHTELHVRANVDDDPWVVQHYVIGTLGGHGQVISDAEKDCVLLPHHPPLMPQDPQLSAALYEGSNVKSYFSPKGGFNLVPVCETEIENENVNESTSTDNSMLPPSTNRIKKGTFAYSKIGFFPHYDGFGSVQKWVGETRLTLFQDKKPATHNANFDTNFEIPIA